LRRIGGGFTLLARKRPYLAWDSFYDGRRNFRFLKREIWPATREIVCLTEGYLCVRTHFRRSTVEEGLQIPKLCKEELNSNNESGV
jgi:hypothetical protein